MWIFFSPRLLWNIFVRSRRRYTTVYIGNVLFSITVKQVRQNGHMITGRKPEWSPSGTREETNKWERQRADTEETPRESDTISAGCQWRHYCRWGLGRAVPLPLMICDCSLYRLRLRATNVSMCFSRRPVRGLLPLSKLIYSSKSRTCHR